MIEILHGVAVSLRVAFVRGREELQGSFRGDMRRDCFEIGVRHGGQVRVSPLTDYFIATLQGLVEVLGVHHGSIGAQHRIRQRVQLKESPATVCPVALQVLIGNELGFGYQREALAVRAFVVEPSQMPDLVEGRIQQVLEVLDFVNVVIGIDHVASIDDILRVQHLCEIVDVFLDDISRPAAAGCHVIDVVLLRRDGVSTRDFQAPSAGINDVVLGGETILHGRMLSTLVAVVVHLSQLKMRVGAASRRRAAVSARRHADQSD